MRLQTALAIVVLSCGSRSTQFARDADSQPLRLEVIDESGGPVVILENRGSRKLLIQLTALDFDVQCLPGPRRVDCVEGIEARSSEHGRIMQAGERMPLYKADGASCGQAGEAMQFNAGLLVVGVSDRRELRQSLRVHGRAKSPVETKPPRRCFRRLINLPNESIVSRFLDGATMPAD